MDWIRVDLRYSDSTGKGSLIADHDKTLREQRGYITLSAMLQEVSSNYFSLKERYEKGETILGKPKLTYDRRSQVKILDCGDSKNPNWKGHAVMDEVWRIYHEEPCGIGDRGYTLPQTSQWLVLCTRIRSFCVNAGSPDLVGDPLLNICRLREYMAGKKIFGTAELLEKINELQEKSREQQSIIASLSFRYLLEKLPPDGTESATMKWKQFWDAIWNDCQPQNADLRDLVEKYRDKKLKNKGKKSEDTGMKLKGKGKKELKDNYLDYVNEVARGMYNTLSTNIHHYSGDVDLSKSSPWDRVQRDILKF